MFVKDKGLMRSLGFIHTKSLKKIVNSVDREGTLKKAVVIHVIVNNYRISDILMK